MKLLRSSILQNENTAIIQEEAVLCEKGRIATNKSEYEYSQAFLCINSFKNHLIPSGVRVQPGRGQIIVTSPVKNPGKSLGYYNSGYDYWRWL